MPRTLAGPPRRIDNNFTLLRTIAAAAVIVSHAFPLATGRGDVEPFIASGWTPGACAVVVFFAISGFLIAGSFERRPDAVRFVAARSRRIVPAHLVALAVVTFGFGPVATTLDPWQFYTNPATWRFVIYNAQFVTDVKGLPGVFADNPSAWIVNGSLWTLPFEITCYLLLYACGRLGLLTRARCGWLFLVTMTFSALARHQGTLGMLPHVLPSFVTGILLYTYRERIPASAAIFGVLLLATWLTRGLVLNAELARATIAYGAVAFATGTSRPGRFAARHGDYSYGIYLYGWPVTQMTIWAHPGIGVAALIPIAMAGTAVLAAASWYWVESPALRWRPRDRAAKASKVELATSM